jgi:hypothetical protein
MRHSKRLIAPFCVFLAFGIFSCYAGTVKLIESYENVRLFHPIVRIIAGGVMCGASMTGLLSFAFRGVIESRGFRGDQPPPARSDAAVAGPQSALNPPHSR